MTDEIPQDVKRTLHMALDAVERQVDIDPSVTGMGAPNKEEIEAAKEWLQNQ